MKQFFESNLQGIALHDYQSAIIQWRDEATRVWRENCQVYNPQKGFNTEVPPPFFIDKYSFRSWLASKCPTLQQEHTNIPETDFSRMFGSYDETVQKSVVGSKLLGTKPPSYVRPVRRSAFIDDLFGTWQKHLLCNGVF